MFKIGDKVIRRWNGVVCEIISSNGGGEWMIKNLINGEVRADLESNFTIPTEEELETGREVFNVGDLVFCNDRASWNDPYEIVEKYGEHFRLKGVRTGGTRFCRLWRVSRKCSPRELEMMQREGTDTEPDY